MQFECFCIQEHFLECFFCFCFRLQIFLLFTCCIFRIYRQYLPVLLYPFHLSFKKFGAFYHPHCLLSSLLVLFAPVLFFSVVFISQLKFSFVSSFSLTLSAHFPSFANPDLCCSSRILSFSQCLCLEIDMIDLISSWLCLWCFPLSLWVVFCSLFSFFLRAACLGFSLFVVHFCVNRVVLNLQEEAVWRCAGFTELLFHSFHMVTRVLSVILGSAPLDS